MIAAVTVFCGSSNAVEQKYFTAARELGEKLARRGWRLVYGGGSVGLMGVLSRAVLAGGGHVTGVIPKALLDLGVGEGGVSELIVTDGLRDRKAIMDERGDAFVALPGGLGTLEEVLEVLTLKQLGYHTKPVVVLDLDGFYEPLWTQIQRGSMRASSSPSSWTSATRRPTWTRCCATSRLTSPTATGPNGAGGSQDNRGVQRFNGLSRPSGTGACHRGVNRD